MLGLVLGFAGLRWAKLRWPIAVLSPLYAVALFLVVVVLVLRSPIGLEGVGTLGVIVLVGLAVLSFGPVVSIFTGTRTWTLVAAVIAGLLFIYFFIGLVTWFPLVTGLIAASIAGPPMRARLGSVAADDDRLHALH